MASFNFNSFKEANFKAKELVLGGYKNVRIMRNADEFVVEFNQTNVNANQNTELLISEMIDDAKIYTETIEDCLQYITEIQTLLNEESNIEEEIKVQALRTIKELQLKKDNLPSSIQKDNQNLRKEKIRKLNKNAPTCKVHLIKMILQESENGFFWGCPNFSLPAQDKCFQKKRLSKDEMSFLYD
jgi:hypothetical protein